MFKFLDVHAISTVGWGGLPRIRKAYVVGSFQNPADSPYVGNFADHAYFQDLDYANQCTLEYIRDALSKRIENFATILEHSWDYAAIDVANKMGATSLYNAMHPKVRWSEQKLLDPILGLALRR